MDGLTLLIGCLATWRMAYFLTKEKGPFDMMVRIRAKTTLGGMLNCIYCASIWCALLTALSLMVFPQWAWVWALSGGAMLLWRYSGGSHGD